jgi:hypothetical protein
MAMSPEAKAALLARLKNGRAKHAEMRKADPNHKPRKPRKKKDADKVIDNPIADKPRGENIAPIDGAKASAQNVVSDAPVDPLPVMTSKIDVPNLPEDKKKVLKNPKTEPEAPVQGKGLSATGKPEKYNANELIRSEETGMQAIESMLPGQKESIKKTLRKNKKIDPLAPVAAPNPPEKTTNNVIKHVPDVKALEARAPFSMSAVRKLLYQ